MKRKFAAIAALVCAILFIVLSTTATTQAVSRLSASPTPQSIQGGVYLTPKQSGPGSIVNIDAFVLNGGMPYSIFLRSTSNVATVLDYGTTSLAAAVHSTATLPALASGVYTVEVYVALFTLHAPQNPQLDFGLMATSTFTVTSGLTVTVNPASGKPGQTITYTVKNLVPKSSLRIDYAGSPIGLPIPIGSSTYTGTFRLPNNRPTPLGSLTTIKAIDILHGKVLNTGQYNNFQSIVPSTVPYSVTSIVKPINRIIGGEVFTLTGFITPAPDPANSDPAKLRVMWQTKSGHKFPATFKSFKIGSGGAYTVVINAPSLFNGDPEPIELGDQVFLGFDKSGLKASGPLSATSPLSLTIKVRDAVDGHALKKAVVWIDQQQACVDNKKLVENAPLLYRAYIGPGAPIETQVGDYGEEFGVNQGWDPFTDNGLKTGGLTDDLGQKSFDFNSELAGTTPGWLPAGTEFGFQQQTTALNSPHALAALADKTCKKTDIYDLRVYLQGYFTSTFAPTFYEYVDYETQLIYLPGSKLLKYVDTGNVVPDPLIISLTRQAAVYAGPYVPQIDIPYTVMPSNGSNYAPSDQPTAKGRKFNGGLSARNLSGVDVSGVPFVSLIPQIVIAQNKLSEVTSVIATFNNVAQTVNIANEGDGDRIYYIDVSDPYLTLDAGLYPIKFTVYSMITKPITKTATTIRYAYLDIGQVPGWLLDPTVTDRWMTFDHNKTKNTLHGIVPGHGAALNSPPLNTVGTLNNDTQNDGSDQTTIIDGHRTNNTQVKSSVNTQALNAPAQPLALATNSSSGTSIDLRTCASTLICLGGDTPEKITIVDTGWVPAYRNQWGVWPIAEAQVGIDTWFKAQLALALNMVLKNFEVQSSKLFINPEATVGVQAWLDLSVLFSLVEATVTARPVIGLDLPITISNFHSPSQFSIDSASAIFKYQMDLDHYAKVGVCPFCKENSGTIPVIPYGEVKVDAPFQRLGPLSVQEQSVFTPPPSLNPDVANDGFGHSLATWKSNNGALMSARYDGLSWTPPVTVINALNVNRAKVAFVMPNLAVTVYPSSAFTSTAQIQAATFTNAVKSQYIAYQVGDGKVWSGVYTITNPSTGEGGVALAGCPYDRVAAGGCPYDGGSATAAWVRDMNGALASRQFRVYTSQYYDGYFHTAQPIDPASTSADTQPQITYGPTGTAIIAWIRDTDRVLSTTLDRRIVMRKLDGSPIVTPALPSGIAEFSLATDSAGNINFVFTRIMTTGNSATQAGGLIGNRHFLHVAKQTGANTWNSRQLFDSYGRTIRVEKPELFIDLKNKAQIAFRGLGYGPKANGQYEFHNEPIEMQSGSGELIQANVDFNSSIINLKFVGAGWQPAGMLDSSIDALHILGTNYLGVNLQSMQLMAASDPLQFGVVLNLPDIELVSLKLSNLHPTATQQLSITVVMRNNGLDAASTPPIVLAATWDDVYGYGVLAGQKNVNGLGIGQTVTTSFVLTKPVPLSQVHTLYVIANPAQSINETAFDNNQLTIDLGGLPAPHDLMAIASIGQPALYLDWTPSTDTRVIGYRVYRSADGGSTFDPAGSSFADGFVDMTAENDIDYLYCVTAFDTNGYESACSDPTVGILTTYKTYLPLAMKN